MKAGELAERALGQVCKTNGSVEDIKNDSSVIKVHVLFVYISLYAYGHMFMHLLAPA